LAYVSETVSSGTSPAEPVSWNDETSTSPSVIVRNSSRASPAFRAVRTAELGLAGASAATRPGPGRLGDAPAEGLEHELALVLRVVRLALDPVELQ